MSITSLVFSACSPHFSTLHFLFFLLSLNMHIWTWYVFPNFLPCWHLVSGKLHHLALINSLLKNFALLTSRSNGGSFLKYTYKRLQTLTLSPLERGFLRYVIHLDKIDQISLKPALDEKRWLEAFNRDLKSLVYLRDVQWSGDAWGNSLIVYPPTKFQYSIENCKRYRDSKATCPDCWQVQKDYATKTAPQVRIKKRKK